MNPKLALTLTCALLSSISQADVFTYGVANLTLSEFSDDNIQKSPYQKSALHIFQHGSSGPFGYYVGLEVNEHTTVSNAQLGYYNRDFILSIGREEKTQYELTNSSSSDLVTQPISLNGKYYDDHLYSIDGLHLSKSFNHYRSRVMFDASYGKAVIEPLNDHIPSLLSEGSRDGTSWFEPERILDFNLTYSSSSYEVIGNYYRIWGDVEEIGPNGPFVVLDYSDYISLLIDYPIDNFTLTVGGLYYRFNMVNPSSGYTNTDDFISHGWFVSLNFAVTDKITTYVTQSDKDTDAELTDGAILSGSLYEAQTYENATTLGFTYKVTESLTLLFEYTNVQGTGLVTYQEHKPIDEHWDAVFMSLVYRFKL